MLLSEHAGTHIDSPYHFDPDGAAIEAMPLDGLLARARMLDLTAKRPLEGIGPDDLDAALPPLAAGGGAPRAGAPPPGPGGPRPGGAGGADRSRHARPQLPSAGGDPPA